MAEFGAGLVVEVDELQGEVDSGVFDELTGFAVSGPDDVWFGGCGGEYVEAGFDESDCGVELLAGVGVDGLGGGPGG